MLTQTLQPQLNTRNDDVFFFLGAPTSLRATAATTGGAFGLIEGHQMPPGFESPYHVHSNEDEAFYVLEGEIAFIVDGKWMAGGPGTYAFGPRNIPHGFKVVSDTPARLLLLASPGGFEGFVSELRQPEPAPPDMGVLATTAARYGIEILGPLPEFVR